jgi:S-adenosylhomocysteine hydrolase
MPPNKRYMTLSAPDYAAPSPSANMLSVYPISSAIKPHPIPRLPMMEELGKRAKNFMAQSKVDPKKTAFIFRQHILETTLNLIDELIKSGVPPENIYLTGKSYSTNPNVYAAMKKLGINVWSGSLSHKLGEYQAAREKDIDNLFKAVEQNPNIEKAIICDDGGELFARMPLHFRKKYLTAGVEQTRGGFYNRSVEIARIPIVNVAQSAVKCEFESPFIAEAIKNTITSLSHSLDKETTVVGIVGLGNVGKHVTDVFIAAGFKNIMVHDKNAEVYKNYSNIDKVEIVESIEAVFTHSNFIFGCTGQDITADFSPLTLNGHDRRVASTTSEDRELRKFLLDIARRNTILHIDPLSNVICYTDNGNKIEIYYGGFPVNFAESAAKPWNVPAEDIALTQGALFVAIMQSLYLLGEKIGEQANAIPVNVMLDPDLQQLVLELWVTTTKKNGELPTAAVDNFLKNRQDVINHSKGEHYPCEFAKFFLTPASPNKQQYVLQSKL